MSEGVGDIEPDNTSQFFSLLCYDYGNFARILSVAFVSMQSAENSETIGFESCFAWSS